MLFRSTHSLKKHAYTVASSLFITLFLNLIGGTLLQAKAAEKEELATVYTKLASLHLPSMAKQEMAERKVAEESADYNKQIRDNNQKKWFFANKSVADMQFSGLGDAQALRYAYSIFNKNESTVLPANSLKTSVHQDLELNCGNDKSAPHRNVLSKIGDDYTQTKFGKIQLRKMINQPLTDTAALRNRQAIVKALVEDETLFNQVDAGLATIKTTENNFLGFWQELGDAEEEFFGKPNWKNFALKGLNDSEQGLEMGALWTEIGSPTLRATWPLFFVGLWATLARMNNAPITNCDGFNLSTTHTCSEDNPFFDDYKKMLNVFYTYLLAMPTSVALFDKYEFKSGEKIIAKSPLARVVSGSTVAMLVAIYGYFLQGGITNALEFETITKEMQKRLIPAGTFCSTSLSLASLLNAKQLGNNISSVKEIASTFSAKHKDPASADMGSALLTDTFKGEPSFFSNKGRVIHTFNQMRQLRDHFADTMKAVGDIDAYMAIAKLYKKHANNGNAKFCFVEYADNASTPQITLDSFWNPMINPDVVVTNSIEIGTSPKNPRNVIITGPNAGGKSTVLKGITLSIILGQTLGIAPANRMVFTPFHLINTYLNIADSSGVESLFQAEIRRVEELLREIRTMKRTEFSYVIMDEIFTGTNPKEGMAGAYGIAKKISTYPNNVSLIATHFMVLTELEHDAKGLFVNKKVRVNKDEFGKISYIYRLENGITDQAIALDLLTQSGFDSEILADAYHIFNRKAGHGVQAH